MQAQLSAELMFGIMIMDGRNSVMDLPIHLKTLEKCSTSMMTSGIILVLMRTVHFTLLKLMVLR